MKKYNLKTKYIMRKNFNISHLKRCFKFNRTNTSILIVLFLLLAIYSFVVNYISLPKIEIDGLKDNTITTNENNYTLSGKLDIVNGVTLSINGDRVDLLRNGSFKKEINLNNSKNILEIVATKNGRNTIRNINFVRIIDTKKNEIVKPDQNFNKNSSQEIKKDGNTPTISTVGRTSSSPTSNNISEPIRIEFSDGGCKVSFFAPNGYYWEAGDVDPQYGPTGRIGSVIDSGSSLFKYNNYYSGAIVIGTIRDNLSNKVLEKRFTLTNNCNITEPNPIRIEFSNNGCTITYYAPSGYSIEGYTITLSGSYEGGSTLMGDSGVMVRPTYGYSGESVYGIIRQSHGSTVLAQNSKLLAQNCNI